MRKGGFVKVFGEPGMIVKMEENTINGIDYVYYITIKAEKRIGRYHPDEVEQLSV